MHTEITSRKQHLPIGMLILLTFGMALGVFVDMMDISIANVALPYIAGSLAVSPSESTWVITSYAISNAIIIPLTARLIYRFDSSRIFLLSTFFFSLFSLLCATAWSLASLIFFRIIQGFAGGALLSISQALIVEEYPKKYQGVAMGGLFGVMVTAPIIGPIAGGWLTDNFSWPWVFYINVPIGLISMILVFVALGFGQRKVQHKRYDFFGFFLLATMVGTLQVCLDRGHDLDWFNSPFIITLASISFISMLFFAAWNIYTEDPLVDLSFLKNFNFSIGLIITSINFGLIFANTVLLPLWLQTMQGYTSLLAGYSVATLGIAPLLLGIPVGHLLTKMDARILATIGLLINGITFFWFASFNTEVSLEQLLLSRSCQGIGVALTALPLMTISLNDVPPDKYISATGLYNFIRVTSTCGIAVALFSDAWQRWTKYHTVRLLEAVSSFSSPTQQALEVGNHMGLDLQQSANLLYQATTYQASFLALNDLFWLSGWICLILIPFVWLCSYKLTDLKPTFE